MWPKPKYRKRRANDAQRHSSRLHMVNIKNGKIPVGTSLNSKCFATVNSWEVQLIHGSTFPSSNMVKTSCFISTFILIRNRERLLAVLQFTVADARSHMLGRTYRSCVQKAAGRRGPPAFRQRKPPHPLGMRRLMIPNLGRFQLTPRQRRPPCGRSERRGRCRT